MELRCRPGDLAVVVFAENPQNVGLIVRVLKAHCGRGRLALKGKGPLWSVACAQPLIYKLGDKYIPRRRGPVPDSYLQPIRGADGRLSSKREAPIVCYLP